MGYDFGGLGLYAAGFLALCFCIAFARRKRAWATALLVYLAAPVVWVIYEVSAKSANNNRALMSADERRRDSEQNFIRFCRERGENLPACERHRTGQPVGR